MRLDCFNDDFNGFNNDADEDAHNDDAAGCGQHQIKEPHPGSALAEILYERDKFRVDKIIVVKHGERNHGDDGIYGDD